MPQESPKRKVKKHQQMIQALELRAAGASYRQIGETLGVSKPRAFRIVSAALDELTVHCRDTAERVRLLELHRLDRYRLALDGKKSDPRTADTLIRISERVAKLHGLDAPQKTELSGPNGGPLRTEEEKPDFGAFSHDELLIFHALHRKAHGDPDWDSDIRYFGTEMSQRMHPERLITAFAKALPFGDEEWRRLPQVAQRQAQP